MWSAPHPRWRTVGTTPCCADAFLRGIKPFALEVFLSREPTQEELSERRIYLMERRRS